MQKSVAVPTRIFFASPLLVGAPSGSGQGSSLKNWEAVCRQAATLGFDAILTAPWWRHAIDDPFLVDDPDRPADAYDDASSLTETHTQLSHIATAHGLRLIVEISLDRALARGAWATRESQWFGAPRDEQVALDPRLPLHDRDVLPLLWRDGRLPDGMIAQWADRLAGWVHAGAIGFSLRGLDRLSALDATELVAHVRSLHADAIFIAHTPGLPSWRVSEFANVGFDATLLSLPWWDLRASWLVEEFERLRAVAPVIAPVALPTSPEERGRSESVSSTRKLSLARAATVIGDSMLIPQEWIQDPVFSLGLGDLLQLKAQESAPLAGALRQLTGPLSPCTALFRGDGLPFADETLNNRPGRLWIGNPDAGSETVAEWSLIAARLPGGYSQFVVPGKKKNSGARLDPLLKPDDSRLLLVERLPAIAEPIPAMDEQRKRVAAALKSARIAIENVVPAVDDGRFPLKRTVGESIGVEADVFIDGHDHIAVELLWRPIDETHWNSVPMRHLGNDRWAAEFAARRFGRHKYKIRAWRDAWNTYRDELAKKHAAGLEVTLEVEEGRIMLAAAIARTTTVNPDLKDALIALAQKAGAHTVAMPKPKRSRAKVVGVAATAATDPAPIQAATAAQIEALLGDEATALMVAATDRPFQTESDVTYPLNAERQAARFASWYELFPRSQSAETGKHGTFDDVIARLPAIQAMGFDVLYFPPIHPIGKRNRKGKNNTLTPSESDPGSPYAIGASTGGHDAIHAELGTLADFRRLVAAAHEHSLEVALDFAIQCSPDHPWLADHPEWFAWRADGSLRYAENPPKKYEDIVNVDFYSSSATAPRQAALWRALRDVVLFWADQGVRTFRVDNPHTKPLPFWQWMISEVQARRPDVVFLSEAFTRPKMMYRLAKCGFSQSYSYFTWRENKAEITEYLNALNEPPIADVFRPNFFPNTPDINPHFLQTSGRAGFLIRMALASTLSGLWGMYSGFELCESAGITGKEEYLDSEKYEVRQRDWQQPGNIIGEITQMNHIRRANPALQTHLGVHFHSARNDNILFFSKATPEHDNVVLVAISLDPHSPQSATLEVPIWELGLPDDGTVRADDLLHGYTYWWQGKIQHVDLSPLEPYRVWRLSRS